MLDDPHLLALCASFLFGLALVLTQLGLRHVPPTRGASISIPTSAVLLSVLAPFMLDWEGWDPRGALIFVLVGLLFPATVTLLTFEANRRMGPNISGALSNLPSNDVPIKKPEVILAALIVIVPVLLIFMLAQRFVRSGLLSGAEKG